MNEAALAASAPKPKLSKQIKRQSSAILQSAPKMQPNLDAAE